MDVDGHSETLDDDELITDGMEIAEEEFAEVVGDE